MAAWKGLKSSSRMNYGNGILFFQYLIHELDFFKVNGRVKRDAVQYLFFKFHLVYELKGNNPGKNNGES